MKIKRLNYRIIIASLLFAAAGAIPALGWYKYPQHGVAGRIVNLDRVGAEGGVCSAPQQSVPCNHSYNDQMFVNRFWIYSAPYAVPQHVIANAYIYRWNFNTNSWQIYGPPSRTGVKYYLAGSGSGYFLAGSPAPDLDNRCPYTATCTPAFIDLPPGYVWTVIVQITWYNVYNNAVLAQAVYYPIANSQGYVPESEIRCAPYAHDVLHRCWGPYNYRGYGALYMR
jgi:hypothetical protein